jgi:mRNA interferase YafQ
LPPRYFDHPRTGEWKDFPDCHLRPDLVVPIHRKPDDESLELVRLGCHSELGL